MSDENNDIPNDDLEEKASNAMDSAGEKASKMKEEAKEAFEGAKEKASEMKEEAKEAFGGAKAKASDFADEAKETANEFKEEAKETFNDMKESWNEATNNEENKKLIAGILALVLGGFGIHKFILGYNKEGVLQILLSVLCGVGAIVGIIEGIIYLTKSDEEFYETYQVGKKGWL